MFVTSTGGTCNQMYNYVFLVSPEREAGIVYIFMLRIEISRARNLRILFQSDRKPHGLDCNLVQHI